MTENKSYDYIQGHLGHMTSELTRLMIVDKLKVVNFSSKS